MSTSPQSVELSPGTVIHSQRSSYLVEKELGEGGFGSVYLVKDGDQMLALKLTKLFTFLPSERIEYAKRFKQEYEYGSALKSNYVVRSYDYDVLDGNPYIVMDYCANGSLRDYVHKELTENELDKVAYGILLGLDDLHSEGIIHRDIKPENVLFDDQHRPRLADFGISASVKKRHTVSNFMGHAREVFATGTYSPPEQIDAKRAIKVMGPTNDIYAFGAMMYEIITNGALPFGEFEAFMEDIAGYEQKKKKEEWNRALLHQFNRSDKWEHIIEKSIRYHPEDRYQTVTDIIADLGFQHNETSRNYNITADSIWMLKIQNGEEIGRVYNLTNLAKYKGKNMLTVGWFNSDDPFTNDVGINEEFTQFISNYHATLQYDPRTYYWKIKDGQFRMRNGSQGWYPSTNGVLVNGRKVGPDGTVLQPEDIITIGDTTLKVLVERSDV